MSVYLLVVRDEGGAVRQGTAWSVRPDLVVTAFHVVGETSLRAFRHEKPGSNGTVTYHIRELENEISLEPLAYDPKADVALLRCTRPLTRPLPLPLAEASPAQGVEYHSEGYPAFRQGEPFSIAGQIAATRGDTSSKALQLYVREGTGVLWDGMSGSPVQANGEVAGLITQTEGGADTMWAAPVEAIRRTLSSHEDSADLIEQCRERLIELYSNMDQLADLRNDLGWSSDESTDLRRAAERLAQRAAQEVPDGLLRLLQSMSNDYPADPKVKALHRDAVTRKQQSPMPGGPTRGQKVREILQQLSVAQHPGVAVLSPLGFGARAVVEDVCNRIDTEPSQPFPVRLVPERRTPSEVRLYERLIRDLRSAIPPSWQETVDHENQECLSDRFEYAVESLLTGPVRNNRQELLFIVEGFARVPLEQLEQWGFLLARLSRHGLKLLVWGGQELYSLRTKPSAGGFYSVFHLLHEIRIEGLSKEEVRQIVNAKSGSDRAAEAVYAETGGHPALVKELLAMHAEETRNGDREAIAARIRDSAHLERLRQIVQKETDLQPKLRAFAAIEHGAPLPRTHRTQEERLYWLGVIQNAGPREWKWSAQAMRQFAKEW